MQIVSQEYKEEMLKQCRGQSYVWVYLGVINREAQAGAEISSSVAPWSSADIFASRSFEGFYATCEQNFVKVDGSYSILPSDSSLYGLFEGTVSDSLLGAVDFELPDVLDIKGLTINFGYGPYPTAFKVTGLQYGGGEVEYSYSDGHSGIYVLTDLFSGVYKITITPVSMSGGRNRLRILSIAFGVSLAFDNDSLVGTDRRNTVDHLSSCLPSKSFDFTVDNSRHTFDVDDTGSYINFLEEQQEVVYEYGRLLSDGTVYKVPGGVTRLKSWSSDSKQARFSTVGLLDYSSGIYYKGDYSSTGITAYDLATDVLEDMGVTDYRIDSYLKNVVVHNPLPCDTHKNCLQLLANLSRAVLYEDRSGAIVIQTSFKPDVSSIEESVSAGWSTGIEVDSTEDFISYADTEKNFVRVDGAFRIIPESFSPLRSNGYVGVPGSNEVVTVSFEAQWIFYGIELQFDTVYPSLVTVSLVSNSVIKDQFESTITSADFIIEYEFCGVDQILLTFSGKTSGQATHLRSISFLDSPNYTLRKDDMKQTPTVAATELVKQIDVHYFRYAPGHEEKLLGTVQITADEKTQFTYSTAYHDWRVCWHNTVASGSEPALDVVESGAYYVTVLGATGGDVDIYATEYSIFDSAYSLVTPGLGGTKTLSNELIDSVSLAKLQAEWVRAYYSNDVQYDVDYRGEPRIDCDDLIYMDSEYADDNLIRITEETLVTKTGMGFGCKLRGRRVSYTPRG